MDKNKLLNVVLMILLMATWMIIARNIDLLELL